MAYEQMWGSDRPGCLIVLIDQSGSMGEPFGSEGETRTKADIAATVVNKALADLVSEAASGSEIRERFDVAVLGYGGSGVRSALGGALERHHLVTARELSDNPLAVEERPTETVTPAGDLIERRVKFRVWLKPAADGGTPMCSALERARELAGSWAANHQDSFPPVVLNVTDGLPTDAGENLEGLFAAASQLGDIETHDGRLLLWNCHITAAGSPRIEWPSDEDVIPPGRYERALFRISSEIPETARQAFFERVRKQLESGARGYLLNADQAGLSRFITFGTRVGLSPVAPELDPDK